MSAKDPYDLIFDGDALRAELRFAGTRCAQDNLLRDYRTGSMHFVRAGRAELLMQGGRTIAIDEPTLVFFARGCPHWVRAVDDAGFDLVCAFTSFGEAFERAVALALPEVLVLPLATLQPIASLLDVLFTEAASQAPGSRQMADRLCEVVLAYVTRHALQAGQCERGALAGARDPKIALALQAIHERYAAALDLDRLASAAGMSRTRFVERFRAVVGTSPHQYLTRYRIGVAQQLLARRVPVKAVAGSVGYATAAAFVRRFKEVVGVPPAAWAE